MNVSVCYDQHSFVRTSRAGKVPAARITESTGLPQVSTGDMLRAAVKNGTETGLLLNPSWMQESWFQIQL